MKGTKSAHSTACNCNHSTACTAIIQLHATAISQLHATANIQLHGSGTLELTGVQERYAPRSALLHWCWCGGCAIATIEEKKKQEKQDSTHARTDIMYARRNGGTGRCCSDDGE